MAKNAAERLPRRTRLTCARVAARRAGSRESTAIQKTMLELTAHLSTSAESTRLAALRRKKGRVRGGWGGVGWGALSRGGGGGSRGGCPTVERGMVTGKELGAFLPEGAWKRESGAAPERELGVAVLSGPLRHGKKVTGPDSQAGVAAVRREGENSAQWTPSSYARGLRLLPM